MQPSRLYAQATDGFFLAMTHWQLGSKERARDLYDQAIVSMERQQPQDEELVRFRAEASQLLELADELTDADGLPWLGNRRSPLAWSKRHRMASNPCDCF